MESELFGKRLREARKHKGLTQEQLGAAMNATHVTVSNWEKGEPDSVDAEKLHKAAKALGTTTDWLLFGVGSAVAESPGGYEVKADLQNIIDAWPYLTSGQRSELVANARSLAAQNREILDELAP